MLKYLANIGFNYGLKDKKLGFSVSEDHSTQTLERYLSAPLSRNYSLMVFPESSFPLYVDFTDIDSRCNSTGYNISSSGVDAYCTIINGTYFIDAVISSEQEIKKFNGSINLTGVDNFRIVSYMMDGGDMIFDQDILPFNLGQMMRWPTNNTNYDDAYNLTSGNYSIYLPATEASSTIMLIAFAEKSGKYYFDTYNLSASSLNFIGGSTHDFGLDQLFEGADISIEGTIESNGDSLVLSNATAEIAYDTDAETGEPTLEYFKFNGLTE